MSQNVNVNLTPGGYPKEFHVSQYDMGRQLVAKVVDSTGDYSIPSGATVVLVGTKPSGFGFSLNGTVSGSTVTFSTTATVTAEYGRIPCEIRITSGDTVLGTANLMLIVEESPHQEGVIDGNSETVIPELTILVERVEAAASNVLDMQVEADTLPAGSSATYSYNEETNTATFGIPQGEAGAGTAGVVASAYSASSTYAVGDYVIHDGNLYRCTTAITTAEAFTAAHWTQVVLGDDVSNLKSDLNSYSLLAGDSELLPVAQGYWAVSDGSAVTSPNWCRSVGFIDRCLKLQTETIRMYLAACTKEGTFVGVWDGSAFTKTYNSAASFYLIDLSAWEKLYPDYHFKISFYSAQTITTNDVYDDLTVSNNLVSGLAELNDALNDDLYDESAVLWEKATYDANGRKESGNGATSDVLSEERMYINAGAKAALFLYSDGEYLGKINASYGMDKAEGSWGFYTGEVNLRSIMDRFSADGVRISLVPTDGSTITQENVQTFGDEHCIVYAKKYVTKDELFKELTAVDTSSWIKGGLGAGGEFHASDNAAMSGTLRNIIQIKLGSGLKSALFFYRGTQYVGKINANYGIDKVVGSWGFYVGQINVSDIIEALNIDADGIKVVLVPTDGTTLTTENVQDYGDANTVIYKSRIVDDDTIVTSSSYILSINHRGYSYEYPENTIPAFVKSKQMGYDAIEADLEWTSDGVPVILHDGTINRTGRNADGSAIDGTVSIGSITYEQALEYDFGIWRGEKYKGIKIPTFEQLLLICKQLGMDFWLDIKGSLSDTQADRIAEIIKGMGMDDHVIHMCGAASTLAKMSAHFPKATLLTGLHGYTAEGVNSTVETLNGLKNGTNHVLTSYYHSNMTTELYNLLSEAGLQGIAWTVEMGTINIPLDKNVYGVFTDMQNFGQEIKDELFREYLE